MLFDFFCVCFFFLKTCNKNNKTTKTGEVTQLQDKSRLRVPTQSTTLTVQLKYSTSSPEDYVNSKIHLKTDINRWFSNLKGRQKKGEKKSFFFNESQMLHLIKSSRQITHESLLIWLLLCPICLSGCDASAGPNQFHLDPPTQIVHT